MSLRVTFGPLEVDFWYVIGGFWLRSSNFEPLGIDFRCFEVKLVILVVLIRLLRVKFELLQLNSRPLEVDFRRKVHFGPLLLTEVGKLVNFLGNLFAIFFFRLPVFIFCEFLVSKFLPFFSFQKYQFLGLGCIPFKMKTQISKEWQFCSPFLDQFFLFRFCQHFFC